MVSVKKLSFLIFQLKQDVTYCSVCNLALTSVSNAQEHYAGKNHMKALRRNYINNEATLKKIA